MNELQLRDAKLDDRSQLDELFHEELEFHKNLMPDIFDIPEVVANETWLNSILDNDNAFLVVSECNNQLVGAILYKLEQNPDENIYEKRKFGPYSYIW